MTLKPVKLTTFKRPLIIAHRGYRAKYPENTLASFKAALDAGAGMIELDVMLTKDRKKVVIHDATLERTTDGNGQVNSYTLKELKELDAGSWFSTGYRGTQIPTLEEALENISSMVELNIHAQIHSLVTKRIVSALIDYGRIKTSYIAIDPTQIPLAREIFPEIRLCSMRYQTDSEKYIKETEKWKCERLQFQTSAYEVTKELVEKAHNLGMFVNVFYADKEKDMIRLIECGADAILTNCPDLLLSVRREK